MHFNRSNLFDEVMENSIKILWCHPKFRLDCVHVILYFIANWSGNLVLYNIFLSADILSALPNCILQTQYIKEGNFKSAAVQICKYLRFNFFCPNSAVLSLFGNASYYFCVIQNFEVLKLYFTIKEVIGALCVVGFSKKINSIRSLLLS